MRILYKLIAGFMIVAALTGVIAYIGLTTTDSVSDSYMSVEEETLPIIDSLEKMKFHTSELMHHYTHGALSEHQGHETNEDIIKTSQAYYSNLNKYEELVKKYFPDEMGSLEKIKRATERFNRSGIALLELGKSGAPIKGSKEYEEINSAEKELIEAIDESLEDENKEFEERSEQVVSTIKSTRDSILLISLITFILSIVIGVVISFSISKPMIRLTGAAHEISRGKLDTVVDIKSNDETSVLAGAFNKMVRDLAHEINEHKLTAANLMEKNDFVKSVLESLPHPFYVIDAKDYTITLANSAACAKGFADGMTCYALTHKTDKPCGTEGHQCPLEEVKRTGKPAVAEHLHYDKDGNVRNMEVHCYPIFDNNGNVVKAIEYSLDITERKRAEETIRDREAKYHTLFESSSDAIMMLDENGFFDCNTATLRMFGYSEKEDFLKMKPSDVSPPYQPDGADSLKAANNKITEAFRKGSNLFEWMHRRKNGEDFPAEVLLTAFQFRGKQVLQATVRDITERKRSEEALAESEERFRSVSQSASDAIITSDGDGKIIFWNNGAQKIFGYQSHEVIGKPLRILMPQRYREAHIKGRERMSTTGEPLVIGKTVELEALRKDGSEFPMELSLSTWKTGEKTFYSGILRDITERRRNEDMRRENERLALANRAKSEFLTVMSHELRTPLNAIIGFSELLKKKDAGGLNEKQQRYTENVLTSGKLLLRIIDDILDLTRVESGKMEITIEHLSIPVAVNEVLETIQDKAGKQNIIIKKYLTEIEFIDTDGQKFRQVLNNLLGNAVKFSKPEGGTITIRAEKEGDMAKFSVSDTGIGIKEDDMGRLFHSFEQIDSGIARKYGGTGLGLAVSKKLVELLGGTITAQSKYGEGSTFAFTLPITAKKQGKT